MKIFHCDHCEQLVFFENVQCMNCKRTLAYLPDVSDMGSLVPVDEIHWRSPSPDREGKSYRLCSNYSKENVCNWAIPDDDPNPLCVSCRLNRVIPDLGPLGHRNAWYRLEVAKRRLIYTLLTLQLPLKSKTDDLEHGLAFEFLADSGMPEGETAQTGHDDGVITINIAEADDVEREKRRVSLFEPYRTLVGHFRHEIGHYYWDRLVADGSRLEAFRKMFGDERADYGEALKAYYQQGAPADWQERFVSAYCSSHPWEDWAETWAHYLHMTDTLEMSSACGLILRPRRADEPTLRPIPIKVNGQLNDFDRMIENWLSVTYVLNNLSRGLGHPDSYPFVLSEPVIDKLRFVHDTIHQATSPTSSRMTEVIDNLPRAQEGIKNFPPDSPSKDKRATNTENGKPASQHPVHSCNVK